MTSKKIVNKKAVWLLFWISWVAYFSTYLARLNFNAVIVEVTGIGVITKTQAGLIGTCYFFAYGSGQFVSGMLADKTNPRRLMLVGLLGSALLNIAMPLAATAEAMYVIWGLNGFILSLTWSPIMRIFADKLTSGDRVRLNVHFSTCAVAGAFGSYLMCSLIVFVLNWKWVFYIAAILLVLSSILWNFGIKKAFEFEEEYEEDSESLKVSLKSEGVWKLILISGLLFAFPVAIAQGALKDGIITWIPTFLTERYSIGSTVSILLTSILPVVNLSGVYIGAYFHKKFLKNEMFSSAIFYIVAFFAVLGLLSFHSMVSSLIFLIIITTAMYGINLLIVGLMPLKFANCGKAATVSGILNSLVYLGSALSAYGISAVTQARGWGATMLMWLCIAFIGLLLSLYGMKKWGKFKI